MIIFYGIFAITIFSIVTDIFIRNNLTSIMKLKTYIDGKLIRYGWYRNWQAKRSRKRMEKSSILTKNVDEVEVYEPTSVIESERVRYERILAARAAQREEEKFERLCMAKAIQQGEADAALKHPRIEEFYQEIKANPSATFRRNPNPSDEDMRATAFEHHVLELYEKYKNERDAKKS